jgi:hypothetical protein
VSSKPLFLSLTPPPRAAPLLLPLVLLPLVLLPLVLFTLVLSLLLLLLYADVTVLPRLLGAVLSMSEVGSGGTLDTGESVAAAVGAVATVLMDGDWRVRAAGLWALLEAAGGSVAAETAEDTSMVLSLFSDFITSFFGYDKLFLTSAFGYGIDISVSGHGVH